MSVSALILGESRVRLWGLDPQERLRRQLRSLGVDVVTQAPQSGEVLLVRADHLFELRTLQMLLARPGTMLVHPGGSRAAALVDAGGLAPAIAALTDPAHDLPGELATLQPADLAAFDVNLRRSEPPLLELLSDERRTALEDQLYGNSYKGITDLVTKWLWPKPAKRIVRWCAQHRVTPNAVTAASFVLTVLAAVLFYKAWFWTGLAAGWAMTLLDTVDGKLARVTVQSSRFGHYFDHGIDILHPPVWYLCWGEALPEISLAGALLETEVYAVILFGYVAGRLVEGAFHLFARCSIFSWKPFDAWFRLVTARRNPCLLALTFCIVVGNPHLGLLIVAGWTGLTTLVLCARLLQAAVERALSDRKLDSWLSDPAASTRFPRSYRTFSSTLGAYAPG